MLNLLARTASDFIERRRSFQKTFPQLAEEISDDLSRVSVVVEGPSRPVHWHKTSLLDIPSGSTTNTLRAQLGDFQSDRSWQRFGAYQASQLLTLGKSEALSYWRDLLIVFAGSVVTQPGQGFGFVAVRFGGLDDAEQRWWPRIIYGELPKHARVVRSAITLFDY